MHCKLGEVSEVSATKLHFWNGQLLKIAEHAVCGFRGDFRAIFERNFSRRGVGRGGGIFCRTRLPPWCFFSLRFLIFGRGVFRYARTKPKNQIQPQ